MPATLSLSHAVPGTELTSHLLAWKCLAVVLLTHHSTAAMHFEVMNMWLVNCHCMQADTVLLPSSVADSVGNNDHNSEGDIQVLLN